MTEAMDLAKTLDELAGALTGYAEIAGTGGFAVDAAAVAFEALSAKLRTGKLVVVPDDAVERMARHLCFELGRMGDTEAVERNRVEADWPRYVHIATAALAALKGADHAG